MLSQIVQRGAARAAHASQGMPIAALRVAPARGIMSARMSAQPVRRMPTRRWCSSKAEKEAAPEPEAQIPLIGRIGMAAKSAGYVVVAAGILGLVGVTGYYILDVVLPTSSSPLSIRDDAVKVLKGSPDVAAAFGEITRVRGVDEGRGESRRNHVPSYTYTRENVKYTRIKFVVENSSKRAATVWAEVSHDRKLASDFQYLFLQSPSGRLIELADNRPAQKTAEQRREDITRALDDGRGKFYSPGITSSVHRSQAQVLGGRLEGTYVERCDIHNCQESLIGKWQIGRTVKAAPLSLSELEKDLGLSLYSRYNA